MKVNNFSNQSGKSVIEMLIVLAIAGVIVAFAVSQFGASASSLDRQNIAREFKVSLERARFDSVKRRPMTNAEMSRVVINSPTSFALLTDQNQNGTIQPASESKVTDFAGRTNVTIQGTGLVFPVTIEFDHRGHARVFNGATPPVEITPSFIFCNDCTLATANAQNANAIFISPTGTVAMLDGSGTMPTFANPTVTNVNTGEQINPLLAVWDPEAIGSPSPTTTPTPTSPTPTPTPTPTPDPSATPTPTPTATPTPAACTVGQRPVSDNCECRDPLYVHIASGKCRAR